VRLNFQHAPTTAFAPERATVSGEGTTVKIELALPHGRLSLLAA
jgi:hypothetical protein